MYYITVSHTYMYTYTYTYVCQYCIVCFESSCVLQTSFSQTYIYIYIHPHTPSTPKRFRYKPDFFYKTLLIPIYFLKIIPIFYIFSLLLYTSSHWLGQLHYAPFKNVFCCQSRHLFTKTLISLSALINFPTRAYLSGSNRSKSLRTR